MRHRDKLSLKDRLYSLDRNCASCNKTCYFKELTIDHVIPKSWGGANSIKNTHLMCAACNASKQNQILPYKMIRGGKIYNNYAIVELQSTEFNTLHFYLSPAVIFRIDFKPNIINVWVRKSKINNLNNRRRNQKKKNKKNIQNYEKVKVD